MQPACQNRARGSAGSTHGNRSLGNGETRDRMARVHRPQRKRSKRGRGPSARVRSYPEVHFQSGQLVKVICFHAIDPRWHEAEFDQKEGVSAGQSSARDGGTRSQSHGAQLLASKAIPPRRAKLARRGFARQKPRCWALAPVISRNSTWIYRIKSPIDGRVSRAIVTPGNFHFRRGRQTPPAHHDCHGRPGLRLCRFR